MLKLAPGLLVALIAGTTACAPQLPSGPRAPSSAQAMDPLSPVAVSDADFARRSSEVLRSGKLDGRRLDLLAGVVQRQLARAAARFDHGHPEAGLAAVTGALYLMRAGELRPEMLIGGAPALRAAAVEVARTGNEGRALAVYGMLRGLLPPGRERDDVDGHLEALRSWTAATRKAGPMQAVGADQRMAVDRSLFEATQPALAAARDATLSWMRRALSGGLMEQPIASEFERDEAIVAYRAIHSGAATFVALHLRHGDAVGAFTAIEQHDLARIVPPVLLGPLERAAVDNDPLAWAELFRLYYSERESDQPQVGIDPKLAAAAAWGAALELHRTDPGSLTRTKPIATLLLEYGMAEVAPVVLAGSLGSSPDPEGTSFGLRLVLQGMLQEDEVGDLDAARRVFDAGATVIAAAEAQRGRVQPSAARVRSVMGSLEMRAGDLRRARPHFEAAVRIEPDVDALEALAAIDRQQGATDQAVRSLERVVALARASADRTTEAEAHLQIFEIHRERGAAEPARSALRAALDSALVARRLVSGTPGQTRVELLLARVLLRYGATASARQAMDRAYEAAGSSGERVAATLLEASRQALMRGDLGAAREVTRRAVEAGIPDEDLVYVALWLLLVERRLKVSSDGLVQQALGGMQDDRGWPGRLRAWGRGEIDETGLLDAAKTPVEQTEARFYVGLARQAAEGGDAGWDLIGQVARSEAIELFEVAMARDLIAERSGSPRFELPADVVLP
jgi:tetratricopeptide (TPR) repeat protein